MYMPNDIDNTQYYPFCRLQTVFKRLDIQLNEPTKQNSIKVPQVVKPQIKNPIV